MRGLRSKPFRVSIEPAYRPLLGKERIERGIVDDSRRPGLLDRFRQSVPLLPKPRHSTVLHLPLAVPAPKEIVELEILPPSDWQGSGGVGRDLLESLSRTGHHLAFEFTATSAQISCRLSCDALDLPVVRSAFRAHAPEVRLRESRMPLAHLWPREDGFGIVLGFGLSERVFRPLRVWGKDGDALVDVLGQMDDLRDGETALVQLLFAPVRLGWQKDLEEFVTRSADAGVTLPLIRKKFAEPVFAVVLRVATLAHSEATAIERARRLSSALMSGTRSDLNHLIPADAPNHSFEEETVDLLSRQTRRAGMLLSLSELETLAHVPTSAVRTSRLARSNLRTKAAPLRIASEGLVLGVNEHDDHSRTVALTTPERLRHCHIIGNTGSGKTSLLLSMAIQDIEAGNGFAVLDPHGDFVEDVLARIPSERANDVVLFDPADEEFPVGFNVLSAHSELEKTLLASDFVSIFRRLSSTTFGDQMVSVLGNAVLAMLESPHGGTLLDLRRFLIDRSFRERFLESVHDEEVVRYWQEEFPLLKGLPHASVLTRLNTFLRPRILRYMVAQRESRLDMREIMDSRKIFLAKLSRGLIGEENSHLLGSLLVSKISQATVSRQDEEASTRALFTLYMDEFHHFVTPSISEILSGARKYALSLVLAHHEMRQIRARSEDVAGAILSHAYTRIVFQVGDQDAKSFADGFSFFEPRDLQNLGLGEAVARLGRPDFDFNVRTLLPSSVPKDLAAERRELVATASRTSYASSREDVRALLDAMYAASDVGEAPSPRCAPMKEHKQKPGPEPTSPLPGRGGTRHKYIQELLRRIGEDWGFTVSVEETVLDGHGYVDVILVRENLRIACEISITTRVPHELNNLAKCLAAGFTHAVLISDDERTLVSAAAEFTPPDDRVHFLTPEAFILFLDMLPGTPPTRAPKKKGNQGKVPFTKPASGEDAKRLMGTPEAAVFLGLAVQTLAKMRVSGESPPFYKLGRQVLYDRAELEDWIAARKRRSTSDSGRPRLV